ncbi:PD40 domain-containing protein [Patulibacter sp. SYSU D01012]|uniref:PD40 domain-containing protein n=1 Tax=Patulibacter sp. SYSU D01012 TaxID=2817381 RepID=UPI001B30D43E|nr:PD40 domain-containing protein [Patulibacter sp. SYSU D01012]
MSASPSRLRRLGRAATLAAVGLALAAAPAAADSIAYLQDGNVWLATPDGGTRYQVTFDGGYSSVSQSDGGVLVTVRGDRIRVLERDGAVRHEYRTPHSSSMPGTTFAGPFDAAVSPSGTKIAYTWYFSQYGQDRECNPATGCQTVYGRHGTNVMSLAGDSPYDQPGYKEQTGWVAPSWIDDGQLLLSDPIQALAGDAVVLHPGDAPDIAGGVSDYYTEQGAGGMADGEMSRDKTKVAFVAGEARDRILVYRAKGGWPTRPEGCGQLSGDVGRYQSPSWSPDGRRLAFADDTGIQTIPIPDYTNDCGTPTESSRLVLPGARNPDWGPANVPGPRPGEPGPGPGPGGGGPGGRAGDHGGGGTRGRGGAGPTLRLASSKVRLRTALKSGLTVKLVGAKPGKVSLVGTIGKKRVASGRGTVATTGIATVRLRFTKAARSSLKRKTQVALRITGGGVSRTVTLKR